ncbi:MAG: carboxylesterase family protein, partial [Kutzneria sp.]|nr:carboxylesterase family protein [Kutzneria sp.]
MAAPRWTHDNIAAFGGDPNSITVGGQSVGGALTLLLMANQQSRPLFRRALLQGCVQPAFPADICSVDRAIETRQRFEKLLGEDVRTAPWQRIVEVGASMRPPGVVMPPFEVVIGGPDIPVSPLDADLSDFDVLTGWTADEACMWGKPPVNTLGFEEGTRSLAGRHAVAGHPAFVYRFDWQGPPPWFATHCIELPFLFGNNAVWADSP